MPAVVFEGKDTQFVRQGAIVDGVRKTRDHAATNVGFDNGPSVRSRENVCNGAVYFVEKCGAERPHLLFIVPGGLNKLGSRFGVMRYAHSVARRAARITSS